MGGQRIDFEIASEPIALPTTRRAGRKMDIQTRAVLEACWNLEVKEFVTLRGFDDEAQAKSKRSGLTGALRSHFKVGETLPKMADEESGLEFPAHPVRANRWFSLKVGQISENEWGVWIVRKAEPTGRHKVRDTDTDEDE